MTITLSGDPSLSGTFVGTGQSNSIKLDHNFNVVLSNVFVATVQLENSYDQGATWIPVSKDASGNVASWTAGVNTTFFEPATDVLFRLNCTAYTSGTVTYRLVAGQGRM